MSASGSPRERLVSCLERLQGGPWTFVQLRGQPLGTDDIDGDDVDLLGTEESVALLLQECYRWVQAGDCHLRIERRRPEKVELTLSSSDGVHSVLLDLWMEVWQINRRKQCLRFEDVSGCLTEEGGLRRMTVGVEVCVYVQHLICKKKDLSRSEVKKRLEYYREKLGEASEVDLNDDLDDVLTQGEIADNVEADTLAYLQAQLGITATSSMGWKRGLRRLWRDIVLAPPRRPSFLSLMGCDGSGKTSLGHRLVEELDEVESLFTGKHLYRKSLLYKLAVIFVRPLTFRCREKFDEILAPLVYLRACLGLELKCWRAGEKLTVIDRNLIDFLYLDRKSDRPRFSRFGWLARILGRRIPVVHCLVPYEELMKRKKEMTEQGHRLYDEEMYARLSACVPTSYILFNNAGELDESVAALSLLVRRIKEG